MDAAEFEKVAVWIAAFLQNSYADFEVTLETAARMRRLYESQVDPWEAAAAVAEDRDAALSTTPADR